MFPVSVRARYVDVTGVTSFFVKFEEIIPGAQRTHLKMI
jgi:hypothetical protein